MTIVATTEALYYLSVCPVAVISLPIYTNGLPIW